MRVLQFSRDRAQPITEVASVAASSVHLADGRGEAHVYALRFGPGGQIGPHPAGFGQIFLVVDGTGWVAAADGRRVPLAAGEGVYFAPGEMHSKGSEEGMTAIMVQVETLALPA